MTDHHQHAKTWAQMAGMTEQEWREWTANPPADLDDRSALLAAIEEDILEGGALERSGLEAERERELARAGRQLKLPFEKDGFGWCDVCGVEHDGPRNSERCV